MGFLDSLGDGGTVWGANGTVGGANGTVWVISGTVWAGLIITLMK